MATEAQIEANRANAQKSTGPRTPAGKAAVAQNALKHGLRARAAVLQGEDWEEYIGFRTALLEELSPDGVQELEVATRIVDLTWRLRRAGQYQDAVFEAFYDQYAAEHKETEAGPDGEVAVPRDLLLGRMLLADFSGPRLLERALQYERRIESSLWRAKAELEQLHSRLRLGALRGIVSGVGSRGDSGGYSPASSAARADSTREAPRSAGAPEKPLGQTKPNHPAVSSLKADTWPLSPGLSGQTNPICAGISGLGRPGSSTDRAGRTWDLLDQACERQPILTGICPPVGVVGAGERRRTGKR